jgi:Pyridine nucleotide-disulphide oxidoreductase, dimerisation domain
VLLGLLIYGYTSGTFHSRKIERTTYDSLAFRFIAANTHRYPPARVGSWRAARHKELAAAAFNARVIPCVAYTDPEIAWVGLTEDQAKAQGINVKRGLFPWTA